MNNEDLNPYSMLYVAKGYKISAEKIYLHSIQLTEDEDSQNGASFLISSIGLYSLSIEIGIKAILNIEGNAGVTGHDLKDLFDQLSPTTKNEIKNHLSEDRFKLHFNTYLNENKDDLDDFMSWRYNYEKANATSSDFLADFARAIIEVGYDLE